MRNVRLPARFASWADYEDRYRVDVDRDWWRMRCRACGTDWGIEQNRGKMLQRAHVCPNACNGKPRVRSGRGSPPNVTQRDPAEEFDGYLPGPTRVEGTKIWHTFRQVGNGNPRLAPLLHDMEEGRDDLGDDSFLDHLRGM